MGNNYFIPKIQLQSDTRFFLITFDLYEMFLFQK